MKATPKLIHLNGPASIGKDTIAQLYIDSEPFALCIRTDDLITNLGQWSAKKNYDPARHIAFNLALEMMRAHLTTGFNVIVPHLLTDTSEAEALESLAGRLHVQFIEILLETTKEDAVNRVFERGTRGEPGSPPLIDTDRPEFEELYDNVLIAAKTRENIQRVTSVKGDIQSTYLAVEQIINSDMHSMREM